MLAIKMKEKVSPSVIMDEHSGTHATKASFLLYPIAYLCLGFSSKDRKQACVISRVFRATQTAFWKLRWVLFVFALRLILIFSYIIAQSHHLPSHHHMIL